MIDTAPAVAAPGAGAPPGCPLWTAVTPAVLTGPSGIGTSAARVAPRFAPSGGDPAYAELPWGDGSAPPLYRPVVERVNEPLADEVDRRLVAWAAECGFTGAGLEQIAKAGFGRLAMLAHPGCDDPDRLLIAAQLNAVWWAADDYYADDSALGAAPTELPPRLALVMAAMDPVAPAGEFSVSLAEALRADPILVGLNSGLAHLSRHGTPVQAQRVCYSTFAMFVSWDAYAAWRYTGAYPPAWEYLAARQHDSFYTSMTLVDVVDGYELPAPLYYDPRVRRAMMQAGTACVLVNDLYSVAKDAADENPVCNMVLQIAADRSCSIEEATEVTVELHNTLVRDFEAGHQALLAVPSPDLHRFLKGVRAWMAGGFEWHATNPRYHT
ncbi:family 2 encapsulin nanocompartment cargo protein terpene cyclase [Amycolatopsis sp. H20-H5]|uniref:family 2 encapsulin nanocompartment cargo protein terpene cyclase n=1 Tax=Amycolatopsis sp. H20-H5 TaxID=3046309 RepID=UPI002DBECA29|nr:family 2 encapsulin nanocompartment cargo protein terpene cyclase [Amycolatopsis sp. H20-H5]MEC3975677.1 family 2 encapsulin nanocompartment cargo protein terpene cyclase [Amycolatopsis sp. H20-H5]